MRFVGLLMVAGVIGFSHSAEGQAQNLDGGQGVIWVEGGIDSEVPENAIRVQVGDGWPLCRGTRADDRGERGKWRDIGVVHIGNGKCHTLRANKAIRLQENFYYLVPAETEGEVSTEGMVLEGDVEARIAEATAQLVADLQAVHDQTQGMFSEADLQVQLAEATEGMVPEADVQDRIELAREQGIEQGVSECGREIGLGGWGTGVSTEVEPSDLNTIQEEMDSGDAKCARIEDSRMSLLCQCLNDIQEHRAAEGADMRPIHVTYWDQCFQALDTWSRDRYNRFRTHRYIEFD